MIDKQLVMEIAEVFQVPAGTVVCGVVCCDEIRHRDKVLVVGESFEREVTIGGVERFKNDGQVGYIGENVGMLLVGGERTREPIPSVAAGMKVFLVEKCTATENSPASVPKKRPWWWIFS